MDQGYKGDRVMNLKELLEEKKKLANKPTMILIDRRKLRKLKRSFRK